MTTANLTSVIIVAYQNGPVLNRAVTAALTQTAPVEVIVVNNGLAAEVESALTTQAQDEPQVHVLSGHSNIGFAAGCNKGALAAKGDFLLFLGPDCLLPSDAIERIHHYTSSLKQPYLLGAKIVNESGYESPESRRTLLTPLSACVDIFGLEKYFPQYRLDLRKEPLPSTIAPIPAIHGAFMCVPAGNFRYLKGFDEKYLGRIAAMDFCLRFHRAEGKTYFMPDVVVTKAAGKRVGDSIEVQKQKAHEIASYFYENFSHAYPQPVLWLLDALIWGRLGVKWALGKL